MGEPDPRTCIGCARASGGAAGGVCPGAVVRASGRSGQLALGPGAAGSGGCAEELPARLQGQRCCEGRGEGREVGDFPVVAGRSRGLGPPCMVVGMA